MLSESKAFSGFSVDNLSKAKEFYSKLLGLKIEEDRMDLTIYLASGANIFVYEKEDHMPASFTILNFPVENIDTAVDELTTKGIEFEQIEFNDAVKTDEKGIMRGRESGQGPDIAWFKDPAGNTLSILQ